MTDAKSNDEIFQRCCSSIQRRYSIVDQPNALRRLKREFDFVRERGFISRLQEALNLAESLTESHTVFRLIGSGCTSYVNFLLGLSEVNPVQFRLPWQRFWATSDGEAPTFLFVANLANEEPTRRISGLTIHRMSVLETIPHRLRAFEIPEFDKDTFDRISAGELMHVSWDKPRTIRPVWLTDKSPLLEIPASMQKNDTEQTIPLLPWFEDVLLEVEQEHRTGWVFTPASIQLKLGRGVRHSRPKTDWVARIISRIGKAAGIVVEEANARTGRPEKYASAHDLRRSCGERLRNSGVPPLLICRVMRHSSWETTRRHYAPGDVQSEAETLRRILRDEDVAGSS